MAYILDDALGAVGEFKHSFMTVAQFQAQWGSSWVLANAQSIAGSTLATIQTANGIANPTLAPNAMAMFLRGSGSQTVGAVSYSATMGASQNDATKKNGLGISDPGHTHSPSAVQGASNGSGGFFAFAGTVNNSSGVTINPNFTGISMGAGDAETRPANLGVNIFVRIN